LIDMVEELRNDPECPDCHGNGYYMSDDKVGNYIEYTCDCVCPDCDGEGVVEYQIAVDDTKPMCCERCNDGGEDDSDRLYDSYRDSMLGDIEE